MNREREGEALPEHFRRRLAELQLTPGVALAAVSGGADSLALLDLLAGSAAPRGFLLEVAHADHGIHPDSARVAAGVEAAAARYRLPFHLARLDLGPGASETAAREARYAWLHELAGRRAAQAIFTAHHRDDQVETVLMRLLRGSGPAGLAGMAPRRGLLVRPLLRVRRAELAAYAAERGLVAWDDPANRDPRHERAWIRHELLPSLRRRYPDIETRLLRLARQAAAERAGWEALLDQLSDLDLRPECDGVSVAASPLHGYDSSSVRALLAALGRRAGCRIGPKRAGRIISLVAQSRSGAVVELGGGATAELSFDRLRIFRGRPGPASRESSWASRAVEEASGAVEGPGWRLVWRHAPAPERIERTGATTWLSRDGYTIRPWRAGDRIRPLGGIGRRLVVRCMQDARVPRSRRKEWPVVESNGIVVWVPGVCRSDERIPVPGELALRIDADLR